MLVGIFRPARMPLDRGTVHQEAVERQTFVAERPENKVLSGVLRAAQRGEAHQCLGNFDLFGEADIDGSDDPVTQRGVNGHPGFRPTGNFGTIWFLRPCSSGTDFAIANPASNGRDSKAATGMEEPWPSRAC